MTDTEKPKKPVRRRQRKPSAAAKKQVGQKLDDLIEEEVDIDEDLSEEEAEEINAAVTQSTINEEKTKKKKKQIFHGSILAVVALLGYGIYSLFIPYQGERPFGICKVFLETELQYPTTLRLSETISLGGKVRIWFSHVDGFGQYKIQQIECNYRADDVLPYALESVYINRIEVDPDKVALFNRASLPFLLTAELDLTLPWPMPNRIRDLKFDTHLFRRQLF